MQLEVKTDDYEVLQQRFSHLKDDFLYNEGVLQERDDEIECLEGQLKELRAAHSIVSQNYKELELKASSTTSELLIERDRCSTTVFQKHMVHTATFGAVAVMTTTTHGRLQHSMALLQYDVPQDARIMLASCAVFAPGTVLKRAIFKQQP